MVHSAASRCAHVPGMELGGLDVDAINAQYPAASVALRGRLHSTRRVRGHGGG